MAKQKVKGVVTAKLLYLREKPNKSANPVDILKEGTELEVNLTNSTENWYCVVVNNCPGYCMKQFVQLKKPTVKKAEQEEVTKEEDKAPTEGE